MKNRKTIEAQVMVLLEPTSRAQHEGRDIWHQAAQQPVRRFQPERFRLAQAKLAPQDQERLAACTALKTALRNRDRAAIEQAFQRLAPDLVGRVPGTGETEETRSKLARRLARRYIEQKRGYDALAQVVCDVVQEARMVLWNFQGRVVPAIYCPTTRVAVYALAMLQLTGGRALAVCPNPKCDLVFMQERSNQIYCTEKCEQADKSARNYKKNRDKILAKRRARRARRARTASTKDTQY